MSYNFSDVLLVNMRFINKTPYRFQRRDGEHSGLEGSFPPDLSEDNVDLIQFKAAPNLKGDILIDEGIKKSIFAARAAYTKGNIVIEFETRLLYAYEYVPFRQAPKAIFYWEHSATSVGQQKINCRSVLKKHSSTWPYSYSVDFLIG